MELDNHAQASTPKVSYDDSIITSQEVRPYPSKANGRQPMVPRPKKLMSFSFDWVRNASYRLCFILLAPFVLIRFLYMGRDEVYLATSSAADKVRWGSLSEAEQLAESVSALSHSGGMPIDSADITSITLVKTLDHSLVPHAGHQNRPDSGLQGRLVVVGDIHGMKSDLERLLAKLDFDSSRDHLVCAGDMISKGPDSVGVLELLMKLGASAVRGNHEDRILRAWKNMHSKSTSATDDSVSEREAFDLDAKSGGVIEARGGKHKDKLLAKQLTNEQVKWLKGLPVILKVGNIKGMGNLVVVHAGLMPGLELKRQEPHIVMNIRTINLKKLIPSERHKGTVWTKLWNKFQAQLPEKERMTVIYGHDSRRGLSIGEFAKGIDTGCLRGGKLTAFVIEGRKREVKTSLVHVNCKGKH